MSASTDGEAVRKPEFRGKIYDSILDTIGATPIVRFRRLAAELKVEADVAGKLEFFNPLASVKDRIGLAMIDDALKSGKINQQTVLIEPTSGNTGIALAMCAAMMGYKMILVMPENQSIERRQSMAAYGAQLVLTPKEGGMESARDVAQRITTAGAIFLGDYSPTVLGDYVAGPSHTLPTGGAGKSFPGLMADMFQRRTSIVRLDARSLRRSVATIEQFSRIEGLDAHGRSASIRFE